MTSNRARSTTTVALLVVGVLSALWFVRFVIGVFFGLAQAALVIGLVAVGAYGAYRFWVGWTGADAEDGPD